MTRPRLAGAAATVGLLTLLIGLPVLLLQVGYGPLPQITSVDDLIRVLLGRDDGTLALLVVKTVGWITWAILAGLILLETIAQLRGLPAPTLRGLALPQTMARQLVATAAALFITLPTLNPTPAHADPAPTPTATATLNATPAAETPTVAELLVATRSHLVKRGESLWSIAEQHLGDGHRYTEIAALNHQLLHGKGDDFLKPGWTLTLPTTTTDADPSPAGAAVRYTVVRGDTLSQIALDHYGDARAYPRIADASRHTTQPDGRHFTHPDHIDIGWTLTLPTLATTVEPPQQSTPAPAPPPAPEGTASAPAAPAASAPANAPSSVTPTAQQPRDPADQPASVPAPTVAATSTPPTASAPATVAAATPAATAEHGTAGVGDPSVVEPAWLLTGLSGAGALLAGSLWLALNRRRATQVRWRRPGRMIATPPPELIPVEKTLTTIGAATVADVQYIDQVLRRLATRQGRAHQPMPALTALQYDQRTLRLHLAEPAQLPAPWHADPDPSCWQLATTVDLEQVGPLDEALPAPYPQLVTIGLDDHHRWWLYNLEEAGLIHLTGDTDYTADLARHAAIELATAPWSTHVHVECVGIAPEAALVNPRRVRHHHTPDVTAHVIADTVAMIDRTHEAGLDIPTGRATLLDDPLWDSRALLQTAQQATDLTGQLERLLHDHPRNTGTTLLQLHTNTVAPDAPGLVLNLTPHGRLQVEQLGLDLVAVGLTTGEANGCAAIFAHTDTPDLPMPNHPDNEADGWRAHTNQAGQLHPHHTLPRTANPAEPVVSVLPETDDTYLDVAATTSQDLAALAPQIPTRVQAQVAHDDSTLDDDLRLWHDPHCDLPRLMLLGPLAVRVAATGSPTAAAARKPYLTELLAYLATRPHGATTEEVAEALRIPTDRVRKDIGILRAWLGPNPRTGRSHLPDSRQTEAARQRGRGAYQIENLLIDADLFRRLRVRGETRGPHGLTDLQHALNLVTGTPFTQLRRDGGAWLADTGRLDQILQCAIVDVAHLLNTAALANGDLTTAHKAAELATRVAPNEDTPHLDLIAVLTAQGHHHTAQQLLQDKIHNRSDDEDHTPTQLPERTEHIIDNPTWTRSNTKASA